ncbi:MAG: hypothetical protein ACE5OZ_09070 [Candidatus Heimdallarchaeota archaeon]
MVLLKEDHLLNVAKSSFTKGQPAFRFFGSNGKIVGAVENLAELITFLPEVHPFVLQHHMSIGAMQGIPEPHDNGSVVDVLGIPTPISDLPMWILYVLGDADLAKTLNHLNRTIKDPVLLKDKVLFTCREREKFLLAQVANPGSSSKTRLK